MTQETKHTRAPLLRPALAVFVLLTALTGVLYPLAVTGVAQAVFPDKAQGSLVMNKEGQVIGSSLIGQHFDDARYFWGRRSATAPQPYNATASGGSNQGPLNPALAEAVRSRIEALRAADPGNTATVPADLVSASASGLDPHISPAGARFQAARVARVRGLAPAQVESLIAQHTEGAALFGLVGEPRVKVLALNLALDALAKR